MKRRRGMENIENASFYYFFHRAPYPYFRRLPPTLGHRSHHFVLLYRCDSSPFRSEFFIEFLFENFPERLVRNTIIIKKEENRRRVVDGKGEAGRTRTNQRVPREISKSVENT